MSEARKPSAGQRIIKVRNVRLALQALKHIGIDLAHLSANRGEEHERTSVTVDNVISGHSREVLALLWAIAKESFDRTLPMAQFRTEVNLLERKLTLKGIKVDTCIDFIQPGNASPVTRLLVRWVRAVCGLYGVTIRSCSTSFTDGSALCLLVHHYIPSLISWTSIAIPPPMSREVAEDILGADSLQSMESLSWSDHVGMQNSAVQSELEQHRHVSTLSFLVQVLTSLACAFCSDDCKWQLKLC
jgi:hypothetical protein